jgi:hypothetical protein
MTMNPHETNLTNDAEYDVETLYNLIYGDEEIIQEPLF